MSLSSNTLFHFTNDLETLQKILGGLSFWPRYCEEYCWNTSLAVPMCCFCDIPLSQINNHMKFYGSYGIGLSKDWAINNKLINPVFYITKKYLSFLKMFIQDHNIPNQEKIKQLVTRMKPCVGKNIRKLPNGETKEYSAYKFYNEREWRYVPNSLDINEICIILNGEAVSEDMNNKTNNDACKLKFSCDDIRYLFVATEDERLQLIQFIYDKFKGRIEKGELLLLTSKILTKEQITSDF